MKIRQATLKIFLDKVEKLETNIIPELKEKSEEWLRIQYEREDGLNPEQYWAQIARGQLETALDNFRESISELYDFQNERGLVDVHAGTENSA
jgi:hypothetical protein